MSGEVTIAPGRLGGWEWSCTLHGTALVTWAAPGFASFDAIGHIAAHHTTPLPSEA